LVLKPLAKLHRITTNRYKLSGPTVIYDTLDATNAGSADVSTSRRGLDQSDAGPLATPGKCDHVKVDEGRADARHDPGTCALLEILGWLRRWHSSPQPPSRRVED